MAATGIAQQYDYTASIPIHPDYSSTEAALKAKLSRKRTKTGCLTCRKRRIKCGEERPICKNCIKSKRQCEGYSQRVVFRQPVFDGPHFPIGAPDVTYHGGVQPGPLLPIERGYGQSPPDPAFYAQVAPESVGQFPAADPRFAFRPPPHESRDGPSGHVLPYSASTAPVFQPEVPGFENATNHHLQGYGGAPPYVSEGENPNPAYPVHTQPFGHPAPGYVPPHGHPIAAPYGHGAIPYEPASYTAQNGAVVAEQVSPSSSTLSSGTAPWPVGPGPAPDIRNQDWAPLPYAAPPEFPSSTDSRTTSMAAPSHPAALVPPTQHHYAAPPDLYEYGHLQQVRTSNTTNDLLSDAAVETLDDDYYDVQDDEEMDTDASGMPTLDPERQRTLHTILQANNISIHDLQPRRYDTFLYEGILDHYRVEDAANPLRNPATARVFAHFIAVTGPCLSAFERHPRNTSVLFADRQIPFPQRGLWTYTMPMAALNHQGLLHSMLALASLHIARLQNASDTPSRQHYAWACKRINHLLGAKSKSRHKNTTIAASMLLGFYEIFTADHRAWNFHLAGSKQLFSETEFTPLARQLRRLKRDRATRPPVDDYQEFPTSYAESQDEVLDQIHDVDDAIISQLCGREVSYDDPQTDGRPLLGVPRDLDLSNFEILKDLYWWYLKQDAYQSIISGNPLLLDYDRWANCPPRAPIGRLDAVYGSFDHLILLLGRIADFSSRDRKRKLRQMEANGGQWRPAPGMKMPGTPSGHQSQLNTPLATPNGQTTPASYFPTATPSSGPPRPPPQAPPPQPAFFGMTPAPRQNVQMPAAYMPANYASAPTQPAPEPSSQEADLASATEAALIEYGRIRAALREFSESLGPAFRPLDAEFQPPLDTPFGAALFYRSYDIGCLWAVYYMAVIIAIRSHPHAHPAAHAAAAIMSQETAFQANEIGRINAGIVPGPPGQDLNPTLGAALCESCVPSFFAAIQYKSPPQRHATVLRIHEIAVRTGWGSAELIANGCETAWVKAAAAGRGPPYTRILREEGSDDPRLNGTWEREGQQGATAGETRGVAQPPVDQDGDDAPLDRRLVATKPLARLAWAIGVMGTEDDEKT